MSQVIGTDLSRFKRYWDQQAIRCAVQHRWSEAEKINRSIVNFWPQDVDAHNRLGKALWQLGLLQRAKDSYSLALEIDPENVIASRNLERLDISLQTTEEGLNTGQLPHVPVDIFIAESGKTTIVKVLPFPGKTIKALSLPGDPLRLQQQENSVQVIDSSGQPLGQLGAALSKRLIYLIDSGNCYAAAVVGFQQNDIYIVIKETYQHASLAGEHSFPSQTRNQRWGYASLRNASMIAESDSLEGFGEIQGWDDLEADDNGREELMAIEDNR